MVTHILAGQQAPAMVLASSLSDLVDDVTTSGDCGFNLSVQQLATSHDYHTDPFTRTRTAGDWRNGIDHQRYHEMLDHPGMRFADP